MLKLIFITFFSFIAFFFGTEKLKEENLLTLQPDSKALLVTHNGCWDLHHFFVSRGDSVLNVPAVIGHDTYGYALYDSVTWSDTLPTNYLLDFCITAPHLQMTWTNSGNRYFFVVTNSYIYLHSAYSFMYQVDINRIDSMVTPQGFVKTAMDDYNSSLLVVSRLPDSISYSYTFYSIPSLSLDTQFVLKLRPEVITRSMSFSPSSFIFCGDSAGTARIMKLRADNHQVLYDISVPPETKNPKQVVDNTGAVYFLSSPGDSVTNFVKLTLADTSFAINTIISNTGVFSSTADGTPYFIFQPNTDTSVHQADRDLLIFDAQQNIITDTVQLNKRVNSLHSNYYSGFGPSPYRLIMGTKSGSPSDWVYYSWDYQLTTLDSFPSGAAPTWFAEDVGCQIGIEETEKRLSMDIFPNPATDNVQVHISGLAKGKTYDFTITDISGKLLWRKDVVAKEEYEIPLQSFRAGILIFKIDTGDKSISKKVVKL